MGSEQAHSSRGFAPRQGTDSSAIQVELDRSSRQALIGDALTRERDFVAAYAHYREAARLEPTRPEHRFKLGLTAVALEEPLLTEGHLLEATRIDPNFVPAHYVLARFYRTRGRIDAAIHHGAIAFSLEPQIPVIVTEYALCLLSAGRPAATWDLIEPWLTRTASGAWIIALSARVARHVGREGHALEAVLRALSDATAPRAPDASHYLHSAAASLLERARRYDEAFEHARLSNEAGRMTRRPFDPDAFSRSVSDKITYFTREKLEALPHAAHGDRRPLFIVGMPRSGTSLVEQILASHPAVHAAGELPHLSRVADCLHAPDDDAPEPYPHCMDHLSLRRIEDLAFQYRTGIEPVPAGNYVTDKMPHNFLHLEVAALLLPQCRVIHCVRDARDTCVSCYFTPFERDNEFKFNLGHLAAFYRDYERLMAHWEQVLPLPILRVRYEDLVLHTEQEIRRLLEFLNLPWDERCLRFYENQRPVLTASEEQVRQPIYTSSVGRWKHYRRHIGPLLTGLCRTEID